MSKNIEIEFTPEQWEAVDEMSRSTGQSFNGCVIDILKIGIAKIAEMEKPVMDVEDVAAHLEITAASLKVLSENYFDQPDHDIILQNYKTVSLSMYAIQDRIDEARAYLDAIADRQVREAKKADA